MDYFLVKQIHIITAVTSLLGFLLRAWWMHQDNQLLKSKWVKILPHVNDTVLLSAAIYLSITSTTYPFSTGWLGGKIILLIAYIVAGTMALKRGKTKQARMFAFLIAIVCIAGIFCLAIFRPVIF